MKVLINTAQVTTDDPIFAPNYWTKEAIEVMAGHKLTDDEYREVMSECADEFAHDVAELVIRWFNHYRAERMRR